jgi:hypothetical protein
LRVTGRWPRALPKKGDHRMQYIDYLRGEAEKYRQLAEQSKDPVERQEFLDLASTCEEVARCHEELLSGG